MAKSSLEIKMNYNKAISQAASLEKAADELQKVAEHKFQESIMEIRKNWTGENADAYVKKCLQLKENMKDSASSLKETAGTIRRIAKNIYEAEMHAYRLAVTRKK